MKLKDMVGVVFKKDEYVNIWEGVTKCYGGKFTWNGEASEIPEKYLDKECFIFPVCGRELSLKYRYCINIKVLK